MFGFLAFNGGSTADIVKPGEGNIVALAMINTILCGAFSALTYLTIHYITKGKWTLLLTINACLTGMVASCAGCNLMQTWACSFTGIGAALCYLALGKLMIRLRIDDPLDAFAVHAGGGFWGLFSVAFIAKQGVVYGIHDSIHSGDQIHVQRAFAQLGWQMICALAIIIWSVATMIPVFALLKKLNRFRVSEEIEIKGLDIYKHGEAAYPLRAYGHGWDEIESIKDVQHRKRTLSEHVEVSLEELAAAYEGRLLEVEGRERQDSVYYNPTNFEHPEHHHKANGKSHFRKKISFRKDKTAVEKNGSAQVYPSITVENAEDVWADQKL
ncbi:Protein AMT-4 [Aphelenchoides avenae]|nr:Protein AMT-4 [Aphelenchus avenae]